MHSGLVAQKSRFSEKNMGNFFTEYLIFFTFIMDNGNDVFVMKVTVVTAFKVKKW